MLDYVRDLRRRPIPVATAHRRFRTVRAFARHLSPRSLLDASLDDLSEWTASRKLDERARAQQRSDLVDFYEWCRRTNPRGEELEHQRMPEEPAPSPVQAAAMAAAGPAPAPPEQRGAEVAPPPAPPRAPGASRHSLRRRVAVATVLFVVCGLWIAAAVMPDRRTAPDDEASTTVVSGVRPFTTEATTTTTILRPPAEVSVLAVNASGVSGRAAVVTETMRGAGYQVVAPQPSPERRPSSSVYWVPGYENEARAVASQVGLPPTAVEPLPEPPVVADPKEANVVIVVGQDLAQG
ncbi:MAG: LytR C-terminal domain-containing protein [Actinomycetota bacterium]|nr:LytR C-terminal domain-containing protein [Actinomycetota bacterium]